VAGKVRKQMQRLRMMGLAVLLFFSTTVAGLAATEMDSCVCRNGIVSRGETQAEVLVKCGPPDFRSQREEIVAERKGRNIATIDEWTFNFGPNEFMYLIRFVNGRVAVIQSLERGY
jgi:uncharacterized protein DUF2845